MTNKERRQSLSADYRHVLLGMTLEEIERQDRAVKKVIRELKAQGRLAKGARQPAQKMRR